MIDIDNADLGMVALAAVAITCVCVAGFKGVFLISDVKEIILVCVSGIAGQMGKNILKSVSKDDKVGNTRLGIPDQP